MVLSERMEGVTFLVGGDGDGDGGLGVERRSMFMEKGVAFRRFCEEEMVWVERWRGVVAGMDGLRWILYLGWEVQVGGSWMEVMGVFGERRTGGL